MNGPIPSAPKAAMAAGVGAAANKAGVALFTAASVVCADSATATSRVNGSVNTSSLFASGLAACSASKNGRMLASGIRGVLRGRLAGFASMAAAWRARRGGDKRRARAK